MTPQSDPLSWLTRFHGNGAWVLVYAVVAIPLLIGLIRGRAPGAKIVFFPLLALPITALAVLFVSMLRSSLVSWAPNLLTARSFELTGLVTLMLFGFLSGLAAASNRDALNVKRGARIEDGTRLQQRRGRRRRAGQGAHALTLAGIPIPAMDETKHFKMIGTTGPKPPPQSTGEHPIRSNQTFAIAVAISLVAGAVLVFISLHHAATHMQATM